MKKIGIITIPDYNNFGNRLQNYATLRYFEAKGYNVDTLEMNDELFPQKKIRKIKLILKKYKLSVCVFVLELFHEGFYHSMRYWKFQKFSDKYLHNKYIPEWEIEKCKKIGREYDYIVLGSDQIWHPCINKTPNLFFAQFVPASKRCFMSPSFGVDSISESYKEVIRKNLEGVKKISVREKAGEAILHELVDADVSVLCDPTLLISRNEWAKVAAKPKDIPSEYVLAYFLGPLSSQYMDLRNKATEELKCELYSIADKNNGRSYATGPEEFLYSIKNAKLVITDSFHAVVFSIIFRRPFVVCSRLNDDGKAAGLDSRIDILLKTFGEEKRKFKDDSCLKIIMEPLGDKSAELHELKKLVDEYFSDMN